MADKGTPEGKERAAAALVQLTKDGTGMTGLANMIARQRRAREQAAAGSAASRLDGTTLATKDGIQ